MHSEPIMDLAHLGHLELLTPKPEESLRFFVDVMGMTESGRQGDSVFLRGWDDYERYSLKSVRGDFDMLIKAGPATAEQLVDTMRR